MMKINNQTLLLVILGKDSARLNDLKGAETSARDDLAAMWDDWGYAGYKDHDQKVKDAEALLSTLVREAVMLEDWVATLTHDLMLLQADAHARALAR